MEETLLSQLTARDDTSVCACTQRILRESGESNRWYFAFDVFSALLDHPKSLVRNRGLRLLAANVRWDQEDRFSGILDRYLLHITDEKPITARQCIQSLAQVGLEKPQYIPRILEALQSADLTKYRDTMRPLLEKDIAETMLQLRRMAE